LYDEKPEYVGATIHMLSKGLDSGDMLYHALPSLKDEDPFLFTMKAVESAQISLIERIGSMELFEIVPIKQDKLSEIRYTKNSDFTDEVVINFISRNLDGNYLKKSISNAKRISLLNPFYF
jgi:methionyl-tRNA formyltransferase